ncbi:ArsR family transcriptional regulator [Pseudomonas sp. Irchel 3A7]|jgi:predicted Rossmann fold nucleotide-binding protein DprA/Smf involved in DNA uptake|uniref:ArsR family transcriptional regulator n=1 Tax=Pseudomonas sp. Irchel 3A7 TaxID=2008913 RepID=UPI0015AC1338|nr:ArsR family transcriptional regulator [Pseudomonas sp. Irchel 3A7]
MKVSNPLTIIAIFAGLAETLACVALVKLPLEIQQIFVYFVIAFPSGIVALFFFVLYYKNTVLYAPSDFEDQNHYLEANQMKETVSIKIEEIFAEFNKKGSHLSREEIEKAKTTVVNTIDEAASRSRSDQIIDFLQDTPATTMQLSQALSINPSYAFTILKKLELEQKVLRRNLPGTTSRRWELNKTINP